MAVARCAFSEGGRSGGGLSIGPGMFVGARTGAPPGRARLNRGANQRTTVLFKEYVIFHRQRKEKHKQRGHWTGERWQMRAVPATRPSFPLPTEHQPNTTHRASGQARALQPSSPQTSCAGHERPPFNSMLNTRGGTQAGPASPVAPSSQPRAARAAYIELHPMAASSVPVPHGGRGG